jgi:hypothetical protein
MAVALSGVGISVALDLLIHPTAGPVVVLEDAAKFVGMAAWAGLHAHLAWRAVAGTPRRRQATASAAA